MYPLAHVGITLGLARPFRLPWAVVGLAVLLPDVVDKSLYYLGIGNGRFISHSLVFALALGVLFSVKGWRYGLAAFFGSALHLLEDLPGFIPWFFPLVNYTFPHFRFDPIGGYPEAKNIITDLIGLLILIYLWRSRYISLRVPWKRA